VCHDGTEVRAVSLQAMTDPWLPKPLETKREKGGLSSVLEELDLPAPYAGTCVHRRRISVVASAFLVLLDARPGAGWLRL
jgi:hypothetical protein